MNSVTLAYWLGGLVCGFCGLGIGFIFGTRWGQAVGATTAVELMLQIPGVQEAIDKETEEMYLRMLKSIKTADTQVDKTNAEDQ